MVKDREYDTCDSPPRSAVRSTDMLVGADSPLSWFEMFEEMLN